MEWKDIQEAVKYDKPLEHEDLGCNHGPGEHTEDEVNYDVFLTTVVIPMLDNQARFWHAEAEQILATIPQDDGNGNRPVREKLHQEYKSCMYNMVILHKAMYLCQEWRG